MLSLLTEARGVVSVDICNDLITKAVKLRFYDNIFYVDEFEKYTEEGGSESGLPFSKDVETVCAVLGDNHSVAFAVTEVTPENLEIQKRKCGVSATQHIADYVNAGRGGLIVALRRETSAEVVEGVLAAFPGVSKVVVGQVAASLHYLYLRLRPDQNENVLLANFAGQSVTALILESGTALWVGSVQLKTTEDSKEVLDFLKTGTEKAGVLRLDRVLLCGDCSNRELQSVSELASEVEFFSPLQPGIFEIGRLSSKRAAQLQKNGHQFAAAIASAGMIFERVGVNLSTTDFELRKELSPYREEQKQPDPLILRLRTLSTSFRQLLPVVMAQSHILCTALLLALLVIGYRYYSLHREDVFLQESRRIEQARAASLVQTRERHKEYLRKIGELRSRSAAIEEIGRNQLTVRKALYELGERVPRGVVFSELSIQNREVQLKGYAPDRSAVITLANRLGQSAGAFADVVPVYDDKNDVGNYELTCKYVGAVPLNPALKMVENSMLTNGGAR